MSDQNELGRLAASFREYVKLQVEILKLELVQRISALAAKLVSAIMLALLAMFALIGVTIGAGFYLGERFESNALGFLAIGGFYIFLFLLFFLFGDRIIQAPVRDKIIQAFLGEEKENK